MNKWLSSAWLKTYKQKSSSDYELSEEDYSLDIPKPKLIGDDGPSLTSFEVTRP